MPLTAELDGMNCQYRRHYRLARHNVLGLMKRAGRTGRAGTTAVEFAVLGVPFLMFFLFLFEVGLDFYMQTALDYVVAETSRRVQIGAGQSAVSAAAFKAQYVCPVAAGLLNCNGITIGVQPVTTDFYTQSVAVPTAGGVLNTSGYSYCPGAPGELMLVQAVYASPTVVGMLVPGMSVLSGSSRVRVTTSSMGFVNESFTGPDTVGC